MTAIGVALLAPPAKAAYWSDDDRPYYYYDDDGPVRHSTKRHHRANRRPDTKTEKQIAQQEAKPNGPLVVAVSIDQQRVKVYDNNGLFAQSPVSTGMRGHATPMGVFSVIQKHKLHHSNIYSNAPMPYMQRITWSGVAMHAGVVPGYPASHGCIRLPMAFAVKMWGWTRMGARVIVAPGEISPEAFSHPLLAAKKLPPAEPMASEPPKPVTSAKADKEANAGGIDQLRAGLDEHPVRTADAGDALPRAVSDAPSGGSPVDAKPDATKPSNAKVDGNAEAAKTEAAKPEAVDPVQDQAKSAAAPAAGATDPAAAAKDQSRASESDAIKDAAKAALNLPAAKAGSQIAVFVSGKDSKLYVRQNLKPLFDVPITIAAGPRPLGTHVFTADLNKDGNVRWTAASLPASRRTTEHDEARKSRKHRNELSEESKAAPDVETASAALDRLNIPAEALARIAEAITTGGSLIISDQGIAAGETGEGTDFIIRLR